MLDVGTIKSRNELLRKAKWLEGKKLKEISKAVKSSDNASRVKTKGTVGDIIEEGYFGIPKNNTPFPDVRHLGVELKTCPLKYDEETAMLSVKEPLSLNMINYMEEYKHAKIVDSSFYKKNKLVLFVCYVHDKSKKRSEYPIKYVFYWRIDARVIKELKPDYRSIIALIKAGKATEIHQKDNRYLTLCPKHNGVFSDPKDKKSKSPQPFSKKPAEKRAFRLKTVYMDLIISRALGKQLYDERWWKD
jgi:DNA mismatch repair protein MutH